MKIFCDFDGTIVDTIAAICSCYNEDFQYYKKFKYIFPENINTYEFAECTCASSEYIDHYFNQSRFFDRLDYMGNAQNTLEQLAVKNEIIIVSSGYSPNLRLKKKWIQDNLPFCTFIGVNLKEYTDKSHIDMSGGVFIDDSFHNLKTSNAKYRICYGKTYSWNEKWNGQRIIDWKQLL